MFLCMYARSETGMAFPPVAPRDDDEHMGAASIDIVDVDVIAGSMGDDDALASAAERLSLASAEEADLATAIQRSMEESNTADVTEEVDSSDAPEGEQDFRRALRRHDAQTGLGGIDRPLQYRRAMTGDEAFYLGSVFSRLVIRDDGRSTGSSTERYLDSVRPTDAPRRLPKIVEEEDVTPSREVESLGRFRGQGLDPSSQAGAASVLGLPIGDEGNQSCLLYTSPSPRDRG